MSQPLQATIDELWEKRTELSTQSTDAIKIIESVIADLDAGKLRIAEKINGEWIVNQWAKKAVLLSFRTRDNRVQESGDVRFYDKVYTKFQGWTEEQFKRALTQGLYKGLEGSRPLLPPMPWQNFKDIKDEDVHAMFLYLKSTKPVANVVPAPIPPAAPPAGA